MRRTFNRLLSCLLLLLLPLHSLAAVAVLDCYVEMKQAATVAHVMEGCENSFTMQKSMADDDLQDSAQHSDFVYSASCGMSSSCLALALIAILPDAQMILIDPAMRPAGSIDEFYLSYIPEGLQRPPRFGPV